MFFSFSFQFHAAAGYNGVGIKMEDGMTPTIPTMKVRGRKDFAHPLFYHVVRTYSTPNQ